MAHSEVLPSAEVNVTLFRRYSLRLCYLIFALGLGLSIWPTVIHHSTEVGVRSGPVSAFLQGLQLLLC